MPQIFQSVNRLQPVCWRLQLAPIRHGGERGTCHWILQMWWHLMSHNDICCDVECLITISGFEFRDVLMYETLANFRHIKMWQSLHVTRWLTLWNGLVAFETIYHHCCDSCLNLDVMNSDHCIQSGAKSRWWQYLGRNAKRAGLCLAANRHARVTQW